MLSSVMASAFANHPSTLRKIAADAGGGSTGLGHRD
jgi:hypothetical protein